MCVDSSTHTQKLKKRLAPQKLCVMHHMSYVPVTCHPDLQNVIYFTALGFYLKKGKIVDHIKYVKKQLK